MNSFFASCEQSADPRLRGKPVVVCGDPRSRSGIVLAASYEAKAFGVKTTMLLHEARRLCPEAVFVPSHFRLYSETSRKVMAIFDDFTPCKEPASIDEAYLDMSGTETLFGPPVRAAGLIQSRVLEELDIGCSIGISSNKLLAKMASDMKKPLGVTELYEADVPAKLWPLPVRELFGVGKKTAEKLNALGILYIRDLAAADPAFLRQAFGEAAARYLSDSAHGRGSETLHPEVDADRQSVGNEMTYGQDLRDLETIRQELLFLSDSVGYRLRKKGLQAKCVTLKIKYSDFHVVTRSRTRNASFDSTDLIYATALELLREHWTRRPVRLLGVTVSGFGSEEQLSLFTDETAPHSRTDDVVDALRGRFGYDSIARGSLLGRKHQKL